MSEAIGLVLDHAFVTLGFGLVRWEARAGNWPSAKAVWRNGFPPPVFVPSLLVERGEVVDGWISNLARSASRAPDCAWEEIVSALS